MIHMKRISIIITIMFITGLCLAQPGKRSYLYNDALALKNKSIVKRVRLLDIVGEEEAVPEKVREFRNLKSLSLRPMARSFGRPRGGGPCIIRYATSEVKTLPSWLGEFSHLEELDLIGNTKLDYVAELPKLLTLERLRILSIDPTTFDEELLAVLIQFKKLESLKIRADVADAHLQKLRKALLNAEIVTGIYADY